MTGQPAASRAALSHDLVRRNAPVAARHLTVSGRYRGRRDEFEVELRVDLDGHRPLRRVSADYYRTADGRLFGSMRVDDSRVIVTDAAVTVIGVGAFTYPTAFRTVKVTIPRRPHDGAQSAATLEHADGNGVHGRPYICEFESPSFRTVTLEEAYEQGVSRLAPYNTAQLPSRGARRELSPQTAFAEAGIELVSSGSPASVRTAAAGPDLTWSDAELHAAMEQYFSRLDNRPQWAIWLLHATRHDDPRLQGLMFDRRGLHRQGCAVFYGAIDGSGPDRRRRQLHTCVHELGHGFNLLHCWQQSRATPPLPSRPGAATWMNYPQRFPGGERAFWPRFGFEFDDLELAHLRHAFQDDVIMGGRPFLAEAREHGADWGDPRRPHPALRLRLSALPQFALGVPVTVALQLSATSPATQRVAPVIGPRVGNVDILIRRPDGAESIFEPLLEHCRGHDTVALSARDQPILDYAFIHYGKDGFAFSQPGLYHVRARHVASDGSTVFSDVLPIHVLAPATREDRHVAHLIGGDPGVGALMSLMGSGAPALAQADETLQELIADCPTHPIASVARLVRARHVAREFKLVQPGGSVKVIAARVQTAHTLVQPILDLSKLHEATRSENAPETPERAMAEVVRRIGVRPAVSPAVRSFISSRRLEIASVISRLPPL